MKQAFVTKNFRLPTLEQINLLNVIIEEYREDGYTLTLRQLYYQMVARGYIENSIHSYKRIVGIVGDARLAGLIDWSMITDRNRENLTPAHWVSPGEIIKAAARQFAIDKWRDQHYHIEVMVEKDALTGVLWPVCQELDIGFTANRGYNSLSNMYEAGQRMESKAADGKTVVVFYLGDHDPSGIDMTRDVRERLSLFSGLDVGNLEIDRLALNFDQVETLNPPPNPAKETDSRYAAYLVEFGETSWELDAIEPRALANLVISATEALRDNEKWEAAIEEEAAMKDILQEFSSNWRKANKDKRGSE